MLLAATLAILLLATGLGRGQGIVLPLPAEDQQKINAHLGTGVVGKALPSRQIENPTTYFPLQPKALTYQVTSGPHTGNTQTLGLAETRRPADIRPGGSSSRRHWRVSSMSQRTAT